MIIKNEYNLEFRTEESLFTEIENKIKKLHDYETVDKFIDWICHKFGIGESKELIKNFQEETRTFIDPVKQMKKEEREKEIEFDR